MTLSKAAPPCPPPVFSALKKFRFEISVNLGSMAEQILEALILNAQWFDLRSELGFAGGEAGCRTYRVLGICRVLSIFLHFPIQEKAEFETKGTFTDQ